MFHFGIEINYVSAVGFEDLQNTASDLPCKADTACGRRNGVQRVSYDGMKRYGKLDGLRDVSEKRWRHLDQARLRRCEAAGESPVLGFHSQAASACPNP